MTKERHRLPFVRVEWPVFAAAARLAEDVSADQEHWKQFNLSVDAGPSLGRHNSDYETVIRLAYEGKFEEKNERGSWGSFFLPPHRHSPEGRMLTSLLEQGATEQANNLVFAVWIEENWAQFNRHPGDRAAPQYLVKEAEGRVLLHLARSGYVRKDRGTSEALEQERERMTAALTEVETQIDEVKLLARQASQSYRDLLKSMEKEGKVARRWMEKWVATSNRRRTKQEAEWTEEWNRIRAGYIDELKYRAPIEHWNIVAAQHEKRATFYFRVFVCLMAVLGASSTLVAVSFGDGIAAAFSGATCPPGAEACLPSFSPKGPLLLGSILLVSSLTIWLLRLISKIHLSERHLARSAAEKKSFTEAFLALNKEHKVDDAHEAIVIGSIFRPAQDAFVRDDDSGVDLSAAALLAKAMSGKP